MSSVPPTTHPAPVVAICSCASQSVAPQHHSPAGLRYPPLLIHESWASAARILETRAATTIVIRAVFLDILDLLSAQNHATGELDLRSSYLSTICGRITPSSS